MAQIPSQQADQILKVPLTEPERLFAGALEEAKSQYRDLVKAWHPDRNPGGEPVFQHIAALYKAVVKKITEGSYQEPGVLTLTALDGKSYRIRYRVKHTLEIGEMVVGDTVVAFLVHEANRDLFERARRTIASFRYGDDAMKAEVSRYLPTVKAVFDTKTGPVMVIEKTPDLLLLKDVLAHFNGAVDRKHVAWIQSSLHNLACYLDWAKLAHNAIALDTYFISPRHHSGALLGGWWYAVGHGEKLVAAPMRTITYAPADFLARKTGDSRVDLELVRMVARELMGDGRGIALSETTPAAMKTWLSLPTTGNAAKDYAQWGDVLKDCFGSRRFTELPLTADDFYL